MTNNDCILREAALDFHIPTYDLNISVQDQRVLGDRFEDFLKSIPAVDVRPVVHGEWKNTGSDMWECSVCGYGMMPWNASINFCPNCGAYMTEDERNCEND